MLNISSENINDRVNLNNYDSLQKVDSKQSKNILIRILIFAFVSGIIALFLPWTQNIRSNGFVTTLHPEQRPQTINSVIGGRIEKWYVREGNLVEKGDTLAYISEVKHEYFNPNLVENTNQQISSKEQSVVAYMKKIQSLDVQVDALLNTKILKVQQAKNYIKQAEIKVRVDSINYDTEVLNNKIAHQQFERFEKLYGDGLKSLTELETRRRKYQEAQAKLASAEAKLLASRNNLINQKMELFSIENQYTDKIAKAESEKQAAMSSLYEAEATVTKMQSQLMNYNIRNGMYYILAPQKGYITKTLKAGIGETVKEGEALFRIVPTIYDLAVEIFVEPMDLPLIKVGQKVRFFFDGWPSVVFSGWPSVSYGTYGGNVIAIDTYISHNGKYRILVSPDPDDHPWPKELSIGSGATGIALLNDVPIWYELWRKLSGFPPDYYDYSEEVRKHSADLKVKKEKK